MNFIIFDDFGRILRTGTCPADGFSIQAAAEESVMEGSANDLTQYVLKGSVTNKPAMQITISGLTVADIPPGCAIFVDDEIITNSSDKAEITLEKEHEADSYALRFVLFPYLDYEVTL